VTMVARYNGMRKMKEMIVKKDGIKKVILVK